MMVSRTDDASDRLELTHPGDGLKGLFCTCDDEADFAECQGDAFLLVQILGGRGRLMWL